MNPSQPSRTGIHPSVIANANDDLSAHSELSYSLPNALISASGDMSTAWTDATAADATSYSQLLMELELELTDTYLSAQRPDAFDFANESFFMQSFDPSIASCYDFTMSPSESLAQNAYYDPYASPVPCTPFLEDLTFDAQHGAQSLIDQIGMLASSPAMSNPDPQLSASCISPAVLDLAAYCSTQPASSDERLTIDLTSDTPDVGSSSQSASYSPTPSSSSFTGDLIMCKRRNTLVTPTSTSSAATAPRYDRWKCPYCPHVQKNKRMPDFKRHVATHTRAKDAVWVCCGVPLGQAAEYGVPEEVMRKQSAWEFEGMTMIGGCRQSFSRKDAYSRHLRREKGKCFGDLQALYQRGNNAEVGED